MKPTMLWLNGWGMSKTVWRDLLSDFPDCRHEIPDFSRLSSPDRFYEEVLFAAKPYEGGPLIVIGWSMGGMLAQRLAAEMMVAGLVLISSTPRFVRTREEADRGWADTYLRQMMRSLDQHREHVMSDFCRSMLAPGEQFCFEDTWSLPALTAGLAFLRTEDCRPLLGRIQCPTTVIHGTADVICPYAAAEELVSGLSTSRLITLAGAGHAPMATRQQELAAEFRRIADECMESIR